MADYLCEEADVRAYAKDAYDAALRQFVGISDENASTCAAQIKDKIEAYETSLGNTTTVTFSGTDEGCTITAVSAYGKTYDDTEHPSTLNLPDGSYDFTVQKGAAARERHDLGAGDKGCDYHHAGGRLAGYQQIRGFQFL